MHRRLWEIGRAIGGHVPVFQVEAVVNNRLWAGPLRLLDLRRRRLPPGLAQAAPPAARPAAGVAQEPVERLPAGRGVGGRRGAGACSRAGPARRRPRPRRRPGGHPRAGGAGHEPLRRPLGHEPPAGGQRRPGLRLPARAGGAPGPPRGHGGAGQPRHPQVSPAPPRSLPALLGGGASPRPGTRPSWRSSTSRGSCGMPGSSRLTGREGPTIPSTRSMRGTGLSRALAHVDRV